MRYTVKQFKAEYPDDRACLKAVLDNRYGKTCPRCGVVGVKFHPITGRKGFVCSECDRHIYPLADTIFRKSETSLWNWFYAIYLFSVAKNGVSAKELERHLGVTYKTAWRMAKQIRLLMAQETGKFMGIVEVDETYMGGRRKIDNYHDNKTPIVGIAEKRGMVKATTLSSQAKAINVMPYVKANVERLSVLHTDKSRIYMHANLDYKHRSVDHGEHTYVKNGIHTNNLEGFWSQLKRSINGTYHVVSPKYLPNYVDEFVFRYNHRHEPVCPVLLAKAARLV
jgi:transposase-like protein